MHFFKMRTKERALGDLGERAAAKFLKKAGYKILERGYEALGYEIDIICADRDYLVYVEVKTRLMKEKNLNEPRPASAVTPEKQASIITAARLHSGMNKFGKQRGKRRRMDVVEVYVKEENGRRAVENINHIKGAFNADTARITQEHIERMYKYQ